MEEHSSGLTRRTALKGIGATALAGGVGAMLSTGSAGATMASSFSATNPATVTNDDGNVGQMYIRPRVKTTWKNFDEPIYKVRHVLHARLDGWGKGFVPLFRETPWLFEENDDGEVTETGGTTGAYPANGRVGLLSKNSDYYTLGSEGNVNTGEYKIVVAEDGATVYDSPDDYPDTNATGANHFDGSSLGDDSGNYANGNYGVVSNTSELDAPTDGESNDQVVTLRLLTTLLQRDSRLVMQEEYGNASSYTYDEFVSLAGSHPAVSVSTTQFTVTAENEVAESGTNGAANPGVN